MSRRASGRLLWLGLALLLPLPLLGVATGWVPVGRMLLLGGVTLAVIVHENAAGVAPRIAGLLLGQALLYLGALWLVAWAISRGLAGAPPRARLATMAGLLALGLVGSVTFDVYRTPFAPDAARGNLLDVYR